MKTKVAMLFGGKTVEHEVSVISGIQALKAMDTEKYDVIPVYMTKENDMYIGSDIGDIKAYRDIPALLKKSQRVIMVNDGGRVQLVQFPPKKFGGMSRKNKKAMLLYCNQSVYGEKVIYVDQLVCQGVVSHVIKAK